MKNSEIKNTKFQVRDSEAGNLIDTFDSYTEAKNAIVQFEMEDGESVGFYEIYPFLID